MGIRRLAVLLPMRVRYSLQARLSPALCLRDAADRLGSRWVYRGPCGLGRCLHPNLLHAIWCSWGNMGLRWAKNTQLPLASSIAPYVHVSRTAWVKRASPQRLHIDFLCGQVRQSGRRCVQRHASHHPLDVRRCQRLTHRSPTVGVFRQFNPEAVIMDSPVCLPVGSSSLHSRGRLPLPDGQLCFGTYHNNNTITAMP